MVGTKRKQHFNYQVRVLYQHSCSYILCNVFSEDCKAVTEVLLFDNTFQVLTGTMATGVRHGIKIVSDVQNR